MRDALLKILAKKHFYLAIAALLGLIGVWQAAKWGIYQHHFQAGQSQLQRRDYSQAERHFQWCQWAYPRESAIWLVSAQCARRSGDFVQCNIYLRRAEEAGARDRDVKLERLLAEAQQGLKGSVEEELQQYLRISRTNFPLVAEVLTGEYMRLYRLPEAAEVLNRWIELDPSDVEPWLRRGWVMERSLNFKAAIEDYRRVLELEPQRNTVQLQIAELLIKLRQPKEALAELNKLEGWETAHVAAGFNLSKCHRELGELEEASAALDRLAKSAQELPKCKAERGLIALASGQLQEAQALLNEALADLPREREILYGLQQAYFRLGNETQAERMTLILNEVDQDGRRMGTLITALAADPNNADLRYEGALIFLRNGVKEDGVRWLKMVLEANPQHAPAHASLARHYQQEGSLPEAAFHLALFRKLAQHPSTPE